MMETGGFFIEKLWGFQKNVILRCWPKRPGRSDGPRRRVKRGKPRHLHRRRPQGAPVTPLTFTILSPGAPRRGWQLLPHADRKFVWNLRNRKKLRTFAPSLQDIVLWCNGSTTGFGSVCPGSNPGKTTQAGSSSGLLFLLKGCAARASVCKVLCAALIISVLHLM